MELTGKTAVVTGAGRGLGLAYAQALAGAGASVVVNDVDAAAAEQAVEVHHRRRAARPSPSPVAVGPTEVADAAGGPGGRGVRAARRPRHQRGHPARPGAVEDVRRGLRRGRSTSTCKGTFTCARAAVRQHARAGRGRPPDPRSARPAGQRGNFGQTNYSAAKAGIVGMARTWSMECAAPASPSTRSIPVAATAMTETIPAFAPYVEALRSAASRCPDWLRKGEGFGTARGRAPGSWSSSPRTAAGGVTGQAIGIGGDKAGALVASAGDHARPTRDGGWSADAIADAWPTSLGAAPAVGAASPPRKLAGGVMRPR